MAESVAGVVNEYENVDGNVLAKLLAGMPDPQIRYALAVRNRSQDAETHPLITALRDGQVFRCPFNYAAGLEVETAYLLGNDEGCFALVGQWPSLPPLRYRRTHPPVPSPS